MYQVTKYVCRYSSFWGNNLSMNFVTEKKQFLEAGQSGRIRHRVTRLSCLLGSARGTTRSISVHAKGEIPDLQQYTLFDNCVRFAASLIMMWLGRAPGAVHLLATHAIRIPQEVRHCHF